MKNNSATNNKNNGFSLIEIVVVIAIIGFMTIIFIRNFSSSTGGVPFYLEESVNIMLADIRNVQQRALAGALYPDSTGTPVARCGYGIHYVDSTTYALYVGPKPSAANNYCANLNRNYTVSADVNIGDTIIETKKVPYESISFYTLFEDVYFEPPGPKIYINNSNIPNISSRFTMRSGPSIVCNGGNCAPTPCTNKICATFCVYGAGSIRTFSGATICP